jgi:hypothetical protein
MIEQLEFGLPGVGLHPGDHICGFYFGIEGRDEILIPYLRAGLQAGDMCMCIVDAEPSHVLDAVGEKADVDSRVATHQLAVQVAADAYLRTGGFDIDDMIAFWNECAASASRGGFEFSRVAGETAWLLREPPGADRFILYESELNRSLTGTSQTILCLYDLALFGGGMVVDLLKTHPLLLLGGLVLENPNYLSPDEFLAQRQ